MAEAVIVATTRSPIGRAFKGSLVDIRPDDLSAQMVKALMAKVPQVIALQQPQVMELINSTMADLKPRLEQIIGD